MSLLAGSYDLHRTKTRTAAVDERIACAREVAAYLLRETEDSETIGPDDGVDLWWS
jgi:hypothetical protein